MDTSNDASRTNESSALGGGRFRSLTLIVIFDVGGPLVAYSLLRHAGLSAVTALVLSGIFPAVGLTIRFITHRRVDVIGVVVLAGIVVGSVVGLVSHSAKLVLIEGSVPTAVFGISCLSTLWARYPLMFRLAREFVGPDTAQGREMTNLWQYEGYRRVLRVITAVWGVAFLIEAGLRVVIIYNTSTGQALTISKVMPFVFFAIMCSWTIAYGRQQRRKGERMMAAANQATAVSSSDNR